MSVDEIAKLFVPGIAIIISVISLYFSRKSWRDSNRPLITVRVTANGMAGNMATPLSLIVENTGNRPATNIRLQATFADYRENFLAPQDDVLRVAVERTLSDWSIIPVLANGRSLTTSFGLLSEDALATWEPRSRFHIKVSYDDLDARKYEHSVPVLVADDEGFGGGIWKREN